MEIAIIAHDLKKELMTQLCIAYCGILSKHNLCATGITAKYISDATGLKIERLLTGEDGGALKALADISIRVPARETYRVQEYHLPVYHYLCAEVEREMFGN